MILIILKGLKGYIPSPYPTYETLNEVDSTDDIAIIGTGLSSLDVIRYVVKHHLICRLLLQADTESFQVCVEI